MEPQFHPNGESINIIAAAMANIIAEKLDIQELAVLSTFLSVVSASLGNIASFRALEQSRLEENQKLETEVV
ncbi:MAG TPA: hypothetical protein PLM59_02990 [Oscillospiraceae bacterium]|nr:hypothetical protein [Oscillospiraceae bacterium]